MKRYQQLILAITSGLLLSAAWPVRGFTALIFVAFVPLFFIQDKLGQAQNKGKGGLLVIELSLDPDGLTH